jgi:hypothetical protein
MTRVDAGFSGTPMDDTLQSITALVNIAVGNIAEVILS